ncbi:hypothetical protein GIB67_029949 [Kingdonia uniflora]|uniref:USE1-like protein n=1 Tax=Kingdonia uniflora TaxID=39325 RepID=A0A7J7MXL8_9MAGN|nr:hypothetical protein GIB67_029949 [Kingdonia uniflora]
MTLSKAADPEEAEARAVIRGVEAARDAGLDRVLLVSDCILMGFSKTEINLIRLLNAAPQQQNQAKLMHYVATLREQLEQLVAETTLDGLPRISKVKLNEYSEKIEALASKLAVLLSSTHESLEAVERALVEETPSKTEEGTSDSPTRGLRRRTISHPKVEKQTRETTEINSSTPVKLDATAHSHIEKHRRLQEDLTDEMVGLARRLKESSLVMSRSLQDTEKILDSTEKAVEDSLAGTGYANKRANEIYSKSFSTTCWTWLVMFIMILIFMGVVLLIRVT